MKYFFTIKFWGDAIEFLESLPEKDRNKIIQNLEYSSLRNDKELFKKLNEEIWEFRTLYNKKTYRMLAFWDKENPQKTLVVTTHGFIKKTKKTPKAQIKRAKQIRKIYFDEKSEVD